MTDTRIATPAVANDERVPFQRIFLTGGSGYIGRNLLRHFISRGIEVTALVRTDSSAGLVRALGASPFRGDILTSGLATGMAGCDTLIHAAADTNHGPSLRCNNV